ncbi:MAG: hypothetical protein HYW08_11425 [candidate division NC10 bacterium]|nr:hypothetical protein [candidate division NC10 bacterium]
MLSAHRLLDELVTSLRDVIAPAIADPYPRAQAYMAAVILEYISRQVQERSDIDTEKARALDALFRDLPAALGGRPLPGSDDADREARLCRVIEWLYAERERLGPEVFAAANARVRQTLRQLLEQELKIAGQERD